LIFRTTPNLGFFDYFVAFPANIHSPNDCRTKELPKLEVIELQPEEPSSSTALDLMSLDPDPIYAEIQDSSKPAPASRDPDLSDCAPPKDGYADKNTQTDAVVVYSELQSRDKDSDNHIVAPSGDEYAVPRKLLS